MTIEFQHVYYTYPTLAERSHQALSDISFHIDSGEMVAIVGASGSGKTTLIQHLNGLIHASSGMVMIDGTEMSDAETVLWTLRRKVGLVFQFPELQFFEETVANEIAYGLKNQGLSDQKIETHVNWALEIVGLEKTFLKRNPFHLSGGEQRRVALASILAMGPDVLVLDEPTAGLDWRGVQQIEQILREIHQSGKTVIFVSHDMDLVTRLARRVLVLNQGKLLYDGCFNKLFGQQAILREARLRPPSVVRYLDGLREQGLDISGEAYTIKAAKKVLADMYHQKISG